MTEFLKMPKYVSCLMTCRILLRESGRAAFWTVADQVIENYCKHLDSVSWVSGFRITGRGSYAWIVIWHY